LEGEPRGEPGYLLRSDSPDMSRRARLLHTTSEVYCTPLLQLNRTAEVIEHDF